MSNIDWLTTGKQKGETWEVTAGCSKIGVGCEHCFAARMAATRLKWHRDYQGLATYYDNDGHWTGEVRLLEHNLAKPLHWREPRTIFVNSRSDLFHEGVPVGFIDRVFATIALSHWHRFIILTKRVERAKAFLESYAEWVGFQAWPREYAHVTLGVSCSTQAEVDRDVPVLLEIPAAYRVLSAEPLVEEVTLCSTPAGQLATTVRKWLEYNCRTRPIPCPDWAYNRLDGVLTGCESGPNRRPAKLEWFRSLIRQCVDARVPIFVKQIEEDGRLIHCPVIDGQQRVQTPWEVENA